MRRLPVLSSSVLSVLATVAIPLAVVVVLLRFGSVIVGMAPQYAFIDTIYFYSAAAAYLEGVSPYTPSYEEIGVERYGWRPPSFGPFYYPPTILPLLVPLGLLEPPAAGLAVMVTNAAVMLGSMLLLLEHLRGRNAFVDYRLSGAVVLICATIFCYPPLETIVYGHIKPIFLAGFALWYFGAGRGIVVLQAIGLSILLLKPQLGIPLMGVAFLLPAWRAATIIAVVITAVLYSVAAWQFSIIDLAMGFLSNASGYTGDLSYNDAGRLIGVSMFLEWAGVPTGPFATLLLCALGALMLYAVGPRDPFSTGLAALSVGILAAPTHLTDVVVLLPALILAPSAGPLLPRAMIAIGVLCAGGIDWFTVGQLHIESVSQARALVGTLAVMLVLAGLLMVMRETGGAEADAQATRSAGSSPTK